MSISTPVSQATVSGPVNFVTVPGSPFTLNSTWTKVATTTTSTKAVRISPIVNAANLDIQWVSVAANSAAPTDTYGEGILQGEDFQAGFPLGDIYLKSASGSIAIVKVG